MTEDAKIFLDKLSNDCSPIVKQAQKYFDGDSKIRKDGAAEIFRRPWIAELNYGLWLFPPAEKKWLDSFTEQNNKPIPNLYQELLLELNGCFVYDFSLYGLPESIYTNGLLDRSTTQPLDLGTANRNWIREFNVDPDLFHIGGRSLSSSENTGYFIDGGKILSIRTSGEIINTWNTIFDFLNTEIILSEKQMLEQAPENVKNI
jgi:hypothetical protein